MANRVMARVKASNAPAVVIAFGGEEYVKGEWRPVPDNPKALREAERHPMLEIMKPKEEKPQKPSKPVEPEPVEEESSEEKPEEQPAKGSKGKKSK